MINALEFTTPLQEYVDDLGKPLSYLTEISHINILIGENNSGKSRFIRSLIKNDKAVVLSDINAKAHDLDIKRIRSAIKTDVNVLASNSVPIYLCEDHDSLSPCDLFFYYNKQISTIDSRLYPDVLVKNSINDISNKLDRLINIIKRPSHDPKSLLRSIPRVYIPVLRGVECFNLYYDIHHAPDLEAVSMTASQRRALDEYIDNSKKIYSNKVNKAYGIDLKYIFTGELLYEEVRNKLLGKERDRLFIKEFEDFISKEFYNDQGFVMIPNNQTGVLNVKIGDSQERPLYDLGDGIKQLICILYKAFECKNSESILFVEEPEINLHPGYQRKFISILQSEIFSKVYFFFTTHSNHLVDSCFDYNDISIFKFINIDKTNDMFQVINTNHKDVEVLNLLGVNNSSVFVSNSTIWVEGISDKIYISKYLELYIKDNGLKEYKEGVDYSFVEYGGNNIAHLSFEDTKDASLINATNITNRAFIVLDNDNDAKSKRMRKANLQRVFNDRYYELSVREIENTIKKETLIKCLFKGKEPQYKPGANEEEYCDDKASFIWTYIDDHFELNRKYSNAKHGPTVSKAVFAKEICDVMKSTADMSKDALKLAKKVYGFIDEVNKDIND